MAKGPKKCPQNCPYATHGLSGSLFPTERVSIRQTPLPSNCALNALASRNQDKYFEFHDALMSAGGIVNPEKVIEVAREVGISIRRLRRDMNEPDIQATIDRNLALAQAMRITGTPGFVVGDRVFRGAADGETLQALIDRSR